MSTLPLHELAPAKTNLGLRLGPRTADGRHELVTVMQSLALADELLLEWADADGPAARGHARDAVICPGVEGPAADNLAAVALASFRRATGWDGPPLRLTIAKRVPVAAGLGGGSGDAAAALRLIALVAGREQEPLQGLAVALGADVPAQVRPGRWLAAGVGEQLEALPAPRPSLGVLVLALDEPLSTAAVYAEADRLGLGCGAQELADYQRALRAALRGGRALPPGELLVNDLETAARSLCPAIDASLQSVRASGADATLVSGSGPTVVGFFDGADGPQRAQVAAERLAGSSPGRLGAIPTTALDMQIAAPGSLLSQFRNTE
jgi:4-diphosphocytidyl-2-C-methyl-D-erythritol kinase